MAIRLIVTITALKGKGDEYIRLFSAGVPDVRREPGCEQYDLFRSVDDPDKLVLLERWKDAASLEAHSVVNRPRMAAIAHLRGAPFVVERFEVS